MAKAAPFDAQFQAFVKKLNTAAKSGKKQVSSLRSKAADAALHWVMSHDSRVKAFKSSVKGTPVETAVDKLLTLLEQEAKPAKKAPAKKAAAKKAPAKKAAKKAVKKATKKAPAKKAGKAKAATPSS